VAVNDLFRLDDQVAVVTGASKNIGLEISRALGEAGATVVMNARVADRLEQRAAQIRADTGARVETCVSDVGTEAGTQSLLDFVHERFDQADVLVNNAYSSGDTQGVAALDIPDSAWESTFAVNVLAPFRLIRGLGRKMAAGRGGSVINVLSGSGFLPVPEVTPYGATKAALWMMTRYLAVELAPQIRVNALCPGLTMSDTGGPAVGADFVAHLESLVPLGRAARPDEVAPAAVYLASAAASYTTGSVIVVNGGRAW
jgi:NAD(P)-dependent dehydrogenase (short-subunit alcohol dehydrogenase family)